MAIEKIVAGEELNIPQAKAVRNQKVKDSRKRNRIITAITIPVLSVALGLGLKSAYNNFKEEMGFRQAYSQAVEQYGDSNGDGLPSKAEVKELFQNIFYKTGINFNLEGAIYPDGRMVPVSKLTEIIKDYIEHPFPSR